MEMYPWIPWEMVTDPIRSLEYTLGTTDLGANHDTTECVNIYIYTILETGAYLGNGRWSNGTVPYWHFCCSMSLTAWLRRCGWRCRDSHLGLLHDNRLKRYWGHATSRHDLQHVPHLKHLCAPTPHSIWHRKVVTGDYLQHIQYKNVSSLFHLL